MEVYDTRPLLEHLIEIRNRMCLVVITFICMVTFIYPFSETLLDNLLKVTYLQTLEFTTFSSLEITYLRLKLSISLSIIISIFVFIDQLLKFSDGGLYNYEKKHIPNLVRQFCFLFLLGVSISIIVINSTNLKYLNIFGITTNSQISAQEVSWVINFILLCGILFQFSFMIFEVRFKYIDKKKIDRLYTYRIFLYLSLYAISNPKIITHIYITILFILIFEASLFIGRNLRKE